MIIAPIVLFVYNRPWHTRQTVEALQQNQLASESELFIYSDAPQNELASEQVDEVRKYIKTIDGFKKITIIERDKNWGLANSIIDGVTAIINQYGKIIVLEDDLVTSPYFLKFMNESLQMHENKNNVACIHGYMFPIKDLPETFFIRGADCWGWATWKDKWAIFEADGKKLLRMIQQKNLQKDVDFNGSYGYTKMLINQINGKNNSWAVRWYISAFLQDMLCLYPGKSYVQNIGNDESGTHCNQSDAFTVILNDKYNINEITAVENLAARKKIEKFYKAIQISLIKRVFNKLARLMK